MVCHNMFPLAFNQTFLVEGEPLSIECRLFLCWQGELYKITSCCKFYWRFVANTCELMSVFKVLS